MPGLESLACTMPLLSALSVVTPEFMEFFRLERALRVTLPAGEGGVVHLFGNLWVSGRKRTLESFRLLISC